MIYTLYCRNYHIKEFYVDSCDSGHSGASRFRLYIVLWLKGSVAEEFDMHVLYDAIVEATKSVVSTKPNDYRVASTSEIMREAEQLAITRKMPLRKVPWIGQGISLGSHCCFSTLVLAPHDLAPYCCPPSLREATPG